MVNEDLQGQAKVLTWERNQNLNAVPTEGGALFWTVSEIGYQSACSDYQGCIAGT